MENDQTPTESKSCMSDVKLGIMGLVSITALATGLMMYHGVSVDNLNLVFTAAIAATAGLVKG